MRLNFCGFGGIMSWQYLSVNIWAYPYNTVVESVTKNTFLATISEIISRKYQGVYSKKRNRFLKQQNILIFI